MPAWRQWDDILAFVASQRLTMEGKDGGLVLLRVGHRIVGGRRVEVLGGWGLALAAACVPGDRIFPVSPLSPFTPLCSR